MSYEFYRILHFTGIFMVLVALGGIAVHMINGGSREAFPARRWVAIVHGIGLFFALLAGFGMYAKAYGGMGVPTWVWLKVGIWLVLGAAPVVLYRAKGAAHALFLVVVALAVAAGTIAYSKPFGFAAQSPALPNSGEYNDEDPDSDPLVDSELEDFEDPNMGEVDNLEGIEAAPPSEQ